MVFYLHLLLLLHLLTLLALAPSYVTPAVGGQQRFSTVLPTPQPNRSSQTAMNPSRALLQHTQNTLLRGHCEAGETIDSYCPAAVHDLHAAKSDIRRVKPRVAVCPRLVMTASSPEEDAFTAIII